MVAGSKGRDGGEGRGDEDKEQKEVHEAHVAAAILTAESCASVVQHLCPSAAPRFYRKA